MGLCRQTTTRVYEIRLCINGEPVHLVDVGGQTSERKKRKIESDTKTFLSNIASELNPDSVEFVPSFQIQRNLRKQQNASAPSVASVVSSIPSVVSSVSTVKAATTSSVTS